MIYDLCCFCSLLGVYLLSVSACNPAVPQGGLLFEWFILQFCSTSVATKFQKTVTDEEGRPMQMSDTDWTHFKDTYSLKFAGFVFYSLLLSGIKANSQVFYHNYALRYHGMSRFGVAIQSNYGYGLPLTTMDTWAKKIRDKVVETLRYIHRLFHSVCFKIFLVEATGALSLSSVSYTHLTLPTICSV